MKQTIKTAQIFDRGVLVKNQTLLIENGLVIGLESHNSASADVNLITTGFSDLQVNGGGGVLLNSSPNAEGVMAIVEAHQSLGTNAILPTVITDMPDVIDLAADAVIETMGEAGVLGIHIEGPHINVARKGTHDPKRIRPFDKDTLATVTKLRKAGVPVLLTLAPELLCDDDLKTLDEMGVKVFAGHSAASFDETNHAISNGLTGFTHLYNAMPQMTSREPGIIASALLSNCYCGIIVDGIHVDYAMLKLARAHNPERFFIVSDAMPSVGGPDEFQLFSHHIRVENGRLINSEGSLAGAHIDMLSSVRNIVNYCNVDLEKALQMGTDIPRKVMGYESETLIGQPVNRLLALDQNLEIMTPFEIIAH